MRKKKHPEHVNHERWLISYADFITLLFAFFVVMFASSQVDSRKVARFTESFSRAVGVGVLPHDGQTILPGPQSPSSPLEIDGSNEPPTPDTALDELHASLISQSRHNPEIAKVQMLRRRHELVLRLPEDIVFASGDDSVKEGAIRTIRALAATLRVRRLDVRIEGHTDNRPIHTTRFRSNWDLSTARATTVLDHLINTGGMDPVRLSAAGYGEYHPITRNDTDSNRQLNRRVDLVVTVSPEEARRTDAGNPFEGLVGVGETTDDASVDGASVDGASPSVTADDAQTIAVSDASAASPEPSPPSAAPDAAPPEPQAPTHHSSAH
ncbi:MAG: OmpA family protein [Deltaproteobacteria bacterium]|nr:OmpA family protein [Deltaproteobacteria bacterium]